MVQVEDWEKESSFRRPFVSYGHIKRGIPLSKPRAGRDSPAGGSNLNGFPEGVIIESVIGLNSMDPANVIAVVISGLVRKFIVPGLPSFRALIRQVQQWK